MREQTKLRLNFFLKSISFLLLVVFNILIIYYMSIRYKHNLLSAKYVDYKSVSILNDIEGLYKRMDNIEVNIRLKRREGKSTEELEKELIKIKQAINELKKESEKSNIRLKTSDKIYLFFDPINVLLSMSLVVTIIWSFFVVKGMIDYYKIVLLQRKNYYSTNKKQMVDNANNEEENSNLVENNDEEKYIEDNNLKENSLKTTDNLKVIENYHENNISPEDNIEIFDIEYNRENYKQENYELEDETIEEIIDNLKHEEITQQTSKEEEELNRIKQILDNPKVEIILNLYKNNVPIHEIAQKTSLSIDEIEFVIKTSRSLGKT